MAEQSITLQPGESKVVSFEAVPHEARTYQVSVNGLTGSFQASLAPASQFAYVSDIRLGWFREDIPSWEVDIKNIGNTAGQCSVTAYRRVRVPGGLPCEWDTFDRMEGLYLKTYPYYQLRTAVIDPGEVVTFSGIFPKRYSFTVQYMIKSEAGSILKPLEPKEFICRYCCSLKGTMASFATQEEFDAHMATKHPQYAPMPPLTHFSVRGTVWPDHFYHQTGVNPEREDYGKIIEWRAVALYAYEDYDPFAGWPRCIFPTTGDTHIATSQPSNFDMPSGWISAYKDDGGVIPNSTKIRVYFKTDRGVTGWLDDSGWLQRIPDGATITFEVNTIGCTNWRVQ